MIILVILGFIAAGYLEIRSWQERPWQKVAVFLVLMGASALFSILLLINPDLPVPQPFAVIGSWLKKLWPGGGGS